MTRAHDTRLGWPAVAWAVYDLGYSLFAFVLFARYLGDWVISDLGHPDYYYTSAQAVAALGLLVLMPIAGVVADVVGRHLPLLRGFTLVAVICGACIALVDPDIGMFGVLPVLALGVVAAIATGMTFGQFDPMLARIAPRRHWSLMSGVAVGAGYVGIALWLLVLADGIVGEGDVSNAFLPAALIFLVCSIPLLLTVREPAQVDESLRAAAREHGIVSTARTRITGTLARMRARPGTLRFLMGRLCYADAIGTVQVYAVVYMSRLGGFGERDKDLATLVVVLAGIAGALGSGWLARQIGPKRTLLIVLPMFSVGLFVVALSGAAWAIWVLAPVVGASLGTVYTVDRLFMLHLTPPQLRGEAFGVFNLIGRAGQALGPFLLWGGVIWLLHDATGWLSALDASRVALGLLGVAAIGGLWIISSVDDTPRADLDAGRELQSDG